jgi:quinoprotein glucose dehydrogenase
MLPRCFLAISLLAILPCPADETGEAKKKDDRYPDTVSLADDAAVALKKMAVAPDLKAEVWAAEPLLENPVAMSFDNAGRAYVAETHRRRTSVPDIRKFDEWRVENLALRSVEERVAFFKAKFPESAKMRPTKDRADFNGDGQFDWRDLGIESERVRVIEDSNRDGSADQSRVLVEGFNDVATGVGAGLVVHGGDVFYTATPDLWRIHADGTKEKLLTGFGVHVVYSGHDMHGAKIGPDGRLYWSIADCGARVVGKEGQVIDNPDSGAIFRCDLDGKNLELVAKGLRNPQSLAWNDLGDLFTGDNNADGGDKARWIHVIEGADYGWRIGWQFLPKLGAWNSEGMWLLNAAEHHLAILPAVAHIGHGPAGIAYYPGTGLPEAYREHFFYADFPGGIRSFKLTPRGATYVVEKGDVLQDNNAQKMAGKVMWGLFPSDVAFAPGGGLYVLDWVQGWEKTGKGRIFRVFDPAADKAAEQTARLLKEGFGKHGTEELAKLLGDVDQRVRLGAQFELVKRGSPIPLAQATLDKNPKLMRVHGIWGIAQLARTKPEAAIALMPLGMDKDPEVRAQWAKLIGEAKVSGEGAVLVGMLADPEPRVRFFAAQALGKIGGAEATGPLIKLASQTSAAEAHLRDAVSTALMRTASPEKLAELTKDAAVNTRACALLALGKMRNPKAYAFLDDTTPFIAENAARIIYENRLFMNEAGSICRLAYFGMNRDVSPAFELRAANTGLLYGSSSVTKRFVEMAQDTKMPERKRVVVLNALRDWNTPILRDPVLGVAWRQNNARGDASAELARVVSRLLGDASVAVRTATAEAAGVLKIAKADSSLTEVVADVKNPGTLRATALRALGAMDSPKLRDAVRAALGDKEKTLLEAARQLSAKASPADAVRVNAGVLGKGSIREQQEALAIIAQQPGTEADAVIGAQLDAVTAGKAPKGIWLDIFEAAAKRTDASVKAKLAAFDQSRKAGDPLAAWMECLVGGDAKLGKEIFFEKAEAGCLRCHKVKGEGGDVGPDLAGIAKQRDRDYLLRSIVDPNAIIAPGFENVMVTAADGSIAAGILSSEDAATVTLKSLVDGKPQKIEKAKIKERTGVPSAMPPGLGEVLGKRGLRDVIEYLAGLK